MKSKELIIGRDLMRNFSGRKRSFRLPVNGQTAKRFSYWWIRYQLLGSGRKLRNAKWDFGTTTVTTGIKTVKLPA